MKEKEEFLKQVVKIFEETPYAEIKLDSRFKEFEEWSSLVLFSLIVLIEDQYSKIISAKDLNSINTFEELYEFLFIK
jgi:acyl carrier protein